MIRALKRAFGCGSQVLFECRHCGADVSDEREACPECDRREFVRYEI